MSWKPIALIAAESRDIADEALQLVEFDLKPIPGVYDPEEALKPGAPLVQGTNNVVAEHKIKKGDSKKGLAEADLVVESSLARRHQTTDVSSWPASEA